MQKIKHYISCYIKYLKMNILVFGQYKIDFLAINLASVLALLIGVINIQIIYSQTDNILGWNKYQVLWMLGFLYLIKAIYNTFFINTLNLSYWVRTGKLDIYLVRPLGTFFQLISTGRYNGEFPIDEYAMGISLMVYAKKYLDFNLDLGGILYLIYSIVISEIIYASIIFLLSTMSLWMVKGGALFEIISNLEKLIEYPLTIYGKVVRVILTFFIPLGFVCFYPQQMFFNSVEYKNYIFAGPLVAIILLIICIITWKKGLKAYQSPGA